MKKIFAFILIAISLNGLAQDFPGVQSISNSTTRLIINGGLDAKKGMINGNYVDTNAANAGFIDVHHGAQIWTTSDKNLWLRDSVLNVWVRYAKFSEIGGGQRFGVSGEDATPAQNRSVDFTSTYTMGLRHMNSFTADADSSLSSTGYAVLNILRFGNRTQLGTAYRNGSIQSIFESDWNSGNPYARIKSNSNHLSFYADSISITPATVNIPFRLNNIPYNSSAAVVHLGLDTTTNIIYRKTASGGSGTDLSSIDTLHNPKWDVTRDASGTFWKTHRATKYNVKDFGATGDGVTDDSGPIQRAIDTCFANGGGTVYFPNGIYIISVAANGAGNQLTIPYSDYATSDSMVTIELLGETPPVMFTNPLGDASGNEKPPITGAILQSTLLSNTTILASSTTGTPNFTHTVIRNLGFRIRSKTGVTHVTPQGSAIYGRDLATMHVDNVRCDTESPRDSTIEPAAGSRGIVFPTLNNWANIYCNNTLVTGYYNGFVVGEHFRGTNIAADGNYIGLATHGFSEPHPITIHEIGLWRNKYQIQITGTYIFNIDNLVFESDTSSNRWHETVADIDEPAPGSSSGHIKFRRVVSFVGGDDGVAGSQPTRTASDGSFITTEPMVVPGQYTGYGQGLFRSLALNSTGHLDFKARGNSSVMRIGSASSDYGGFGILTANNGFIYSANSDMALLSAGKFKFGANGASTQTAEININGIKVASSTYGAFIGNGGAPLPGIWLGSPADAPDGSNYNMALSSSLTLLSGPSGMHLESGNDINNGVLLDASKRMKVGVAYNATLHSTFGINGSFERKYNGTATGITLDATHDVVEVTATGQTITLPTAVGITGRSYTIKLTASGSGTVATTSSQTIDGSTTYSLASQYKYVTVQSNGSNWIVIANN